MKLVPWAASMATVLGGCGPDAQSLSKLSTIQSAIFTPKCATSGCHGSVGTQAGLNLSQGQSHGALVNIPSTVVLGATRVVPGDPNASLLFQAVNGTAPIQRMPVGSSLAQTDIDAISAWIEAGARDD